MAGFKEHITLSIIVALIINIFLLIFSYIKSFAFCLIILLSTIFGSIIPDLDIGKSISFRININLFAFFTTLIFFIYSKQTNTIPNIYLTLLNCLIIYLFVILIFGRFLKKITDHRGMLHSIPAVLIAFFTSLQILPHFSLTNKEIFLISSSFAIGYLAHLILDLFKFKKNKFPLKLIKKNHNNGLLINIITYLILLILVFLSIPHFKKLIRHGSKEKTYFYQTIK